MGNWEDARSGRSISPIPEEITSELGRINEMGDGCSMRAVKDSLATPLKRGGKFEGPPSSTLK